MTAVRRSRVLIHRGVDGLMVGWLAVLVWIAVFATGPLGVGSFPGQSLVYWTGAVVSAAHFAISYHLAYRDGPDALRRRPFALVTAPAALALVLAVTVAMSLAGGTAAVTEVTRALLTGVYVMTTWHYVKQVYGVGRIGAAYSGVTLGAREVQVLRYGLYPVWAFGAAGVLTQGRTSGFAGFPSGYGVLPVEALDVLRVLAVASAAPVAVVMLRVSLRRRRPPSLLLAPYVATFLWLALPTDPLLLVLLLAPFHALQYLAVAHRAEVSLAADRPGPRGVLWWLNIFGGAAAAGLLLTRWVPQYLDEHLGTAGGPQLFLAAFFVFLNLHHYVIDASIWRSKGELVRAMGRPQSPTAQVPQALAAQRPHRVHAGGSDISVQS